MKNLWKKIAITLTLVMTFALCFAFVGCNKCKHEWKELSDTATCTQLGIKTYECFKCKDTYTENSSQLDHKFIKTKCESCNLIVTSTWSPKSNCTKCDNVNVIGENKSYYAKLSSTATCTTDGVAYYKCPKCYNKFYVLEKLLGHNYLKNKCTNCDSEANDISQFSESYRIKISSKLELIAPYTVDSETFITSTRLYKLGLDDVEDCKTAVTKAQAAYDTACSQATVRRFNPVTGQWEWVPDEKKVAAAEKTLTSAKNSLKQAETNLKTYKTSYEFNCEGYAWYAAIIGIKATDASNSAVNTNIKTISAFVSVLNETTTLPTFYQTIISSIYDLTGLNISNS